MASGLDWSLHRKKVNSLFLIGYLHTELLLLVEPFEIVSLEWCMVVESSSVEEDMRMRLSSTDFVRIG